MNFFIWRPNRGRLAEISDPVLETDDVTKKVTYGYNVWKLDGYSAMDVV